MNDVVIDKVKLRKRRQIKQKNCTIEIGNGIAVQAPCLLPIVSCTRTTNFLNSEICSTVCKDF